MIRIRPATADDAAGMARVIVDTWFAAHQSQVSAEVYRQRRDEWGYPESEQGWRRTLRESEGVNSQTLVATDDDQIVAVATSEVTELNQAETKALYVDVRYQRSGIGRRLVETAIEHYRGVGIPTLHIAVLASNRPARRFYERLGGLTSGSRDGDDGLEIVYEWNLADTISR